jgi:hypothetical protein
MTPEAAPPEARDNTAGTLFVEQPRFAIVPEWVIDAPVIDAPVSDGAFRLHSLLLRYGNSTGCRMPSRPTLARRLRRSIDRERRSPGRVAGPARGGTPQCSESSRAWTPMSSPPLRPGGLRPALQAQARAELTAQGLPVIRSTVAPGLRDPRPAGRAMSAAQPLPDRLPPAGF